MDNEIRNELKDIRQQLTKLTDLVNKLIESSDQMVTHIDFIESTYTVARAPLDFMFSHINKFIGKNIDTGVLPSLPAIEN
jgi:hypothetical protein